MYIDLEDLAVRKMVSIKSAIDSGDYILTGPRNPDRRPFIDHMVRRGQIDSPLLTKALSAVAASESRIRKARLSNLSAPEKRRFEKQVFSDLIKSVETQRLKELQETADKLFKMRNEEKFIDSTKELLNLQKLQLKHKFTNESAAMALLSGMEKRGYSETELLILSSISKKTAVRAKEVQKILPPQLANDTGLGLIKKLENLLDLRPGEISYSLKDAPNVEEKVHVADLLQDVSPRVEDLEPAMK